jgi:hypothetical protein
MSKQRLRLLPRIVHARAGVAFAQTAGDDASEAARALSLFPTAWKRLEETYAIQLGGRELTVSDRADLLEFIFRLGADVHATRLAEQALGEDETEDRHEQSKTFELIRDTLRWTKGSGSMCRGLILMDQRTLALLLSRAASCVEQGDDPSPGF